MLAGLASHELVLPPRVSVAYRLIEHWLRKASGVALDSVVNDEPFLPGRD